ncbi:MAG: hypothetical protein ACFWTY_19285 [Shouchella clausii]
MKVLLADSQMETVVKGSFYVRGRKIECFNNWWNKIYRALRGSFVVEEGSRCYRVSPRKNKFSSLRKCSTYIWRSKTISYPYRGKIGDDFAHDYEKIHVEQTILNDERLPGTVLRLPMVYGPNDPQRRLFDYIQRMKDGRPYILMDERMARWKASMGYVENVAAAIAMSINHAETASHVLNVGEKTAMSMLDRVTEIGKVMKWDGKVISVPKGIMDTELPLETKQDLVVDTSKIREHFGYIEPISDEEGLRRTVQWELANAPKESPFDYRQEDDMIQMLNKSFDDPK